MNSILKNAQDFWSKIGLNQKIALSAAGVAVIVAVVMLLTWATKPKMSFLIGNLAPKDISEVTSYIDKLGIPYELGKDESSIMIAADKNEAAKVRMNIFGQGLISGDSVGYEIFDKGNFGISDFVQRTNLVRAIQGELGRTISQIQGVRSARVQAVVPENKLLLTDPTSRPTASVFLDSGINKISEAQVNAIRSLVSYSIEGVDVQDVAVIDNHGNNLSEEYGNDSSGGSQSGLKIQERIEKYYAKNIETMLTPIVGAGNVVARVSVEIDTTAQTFLEEKFNPDGQVVRSQTSEEDKLQSTEGKAQEGGVGAAANIPAATGTADGNETQVLSQTDETRKSKTTQYEINRSLLETVQSPGGIAKKQASVFIAPRGGDLPARTAQELEDLRITVANALGINLSEADGDPLKMDNMVVVKEMAFTQPASVVGGMNAFDDFMFKYGQYVKNIIAVIIIFGLVFFFSRMLKKLKPKNEDVEIMDELSAGNRGKIESNLTPELLNDLIQEKPENVSTALKTWMEQGNN